MQLFSTHALALSIACKQTLLCKTSEVHLNQTFYLAVLITSTLTYQMNGPLE